MFGENGETDQEGPPKYPSLSSLVLITSAGTDGGGGGGGKLEMRNVLLD